MPRKKSVVEVMPPEAPDLKSARIKTVAAKHTITYEAPVDVPIVEDETDLDDLALDADEPEEIEEQPRYKPPSFRMKLKQKFQQRGIGGDETLTLRIDRLPNFELNGLAGVKADKEFCGIITCTEKFFDHDEYLIEIQRRYGPGEYWLTVRHKNSIMNSWRERIGGFPTPVTTTSETGQAGSQGFQPAPNQPVGTIDPLAQLRSAFKMVREFKADLGLDAAQTAQAPPPTDPEVILLQSLANNDKFMDKVNNGVITKLLGKSAVEDEPSWAAVGMEAVKSGQVAVAIDAIGKVALNLVDRIFPREANNGQAQMAQAPLQNQQTEQGAQVPLIQGQSEGVSGDQQNAPIGHGSTELPQGVQNQPQTAQEDPYTQMMTYIITTLAANGSVEDAVKRVNGFLLFNPTYAQVINDQFSPDSEQLLGSIATIPGCEQIAQAPHAKQWIEQFQSKYFVEGDGEE